MHDSRFVCFGKAVADLNEQVDDRFDVVLSRDALAKRFALDEFHHDVVVADVVDGEDVRMTQRRRRARLELKARHGIAIGGDIFRKQLDGDVALQPRIARAPHFSHPARAEGRDEFIRTDLRSGLDSHATESDYGRVTRHARQ